MLKKHLMTPGPTSVPPEVLETQARPMIHHRTPEFEQSLRYCIDSLKQLFRTESSDILIFTSSGTGAMESSIVNCFSANDKVIVCHNGKFGERMAKISKAYGLDVIELAYGWREVVNVDDVARELKADPEIRGVIVTHSETSSGILNDVQAIGEIVKEYPNCVLIVDAVTGIGAVDVCTEDWGLDVVITGSQKGLMVPPGLAMVSVSPKAWAAAERATLPKFYFDWSRYRDSALKDTTPFTPALTLVLALEESLRIILDEGIDEVIARHDLLASATRAGMEALGLELFAPPAGRGSATTPVLVPEGIDGGAIVKKLKTEHGITIAGGQDDYKGKIFRIGHLGYVDRFDVIMTIAALEMTLTDLGYACTPGAGVCAAENVFMEENRNA